MQSMLTEPVGPRSPDDILAVVYQRTERARRRHRQQLSAAVAVLAVGVAGLVSLRPGDDEAARVRVVDGRNTRTEEVSGESATPATAATSAEPPASSPTTAAPSKRRSHPSSGGGDKASTPVPAPPVPTTSTLPASGNGPNVKLLAEEGDKLNDSIPNHWYFDIVQTAMQLDVRNDVVVFTTRYRSADTSGSRERRTLRSEFVYENDIVTVDVTEDDNALGPVTIFGSGCTGCTAGFDEAQARLTVTVPISTMDTYLVARHGEGHSIAQAVVTSLEALTSQLGVDDLPADKSGDTG